MGPLLHTAYGISVAYSSGAGFMLHVAAPYSKHTAPPYIIGLPRRHF